jgi:hypothetical protein
MSSDICDVLVNEFPLPSGYSLCGICFRNHEHDGFDGEAMHAHILAGDDPSLFFEKSFEEDEIDRALLSLCEMINLPSYEVLSA